MYFYLHTFCLAFIISFINFICTVIVILSFVNIILCVAMTYIYTICSFHYFFVQFGFKRPIDEFIGHASCNGTNKAFLSFLLSICNVCLLDSRFFEIVSIICITFAFIY